VVQSDRLAGVDDLLVGYALLAVHNVVADRSLKEPRILQDHAELLMHVLTGHIPNRKAVQKDLPSVQLIESHQEVDHCGLARAGRSNNGDLLPWEDMGGEIADHGLFLCIAEANVPELHLTADFPQLLWLLALVGEFFLPQELKDALPGGGGPLEVVEGLGHLRQGLGEEPHIEHKCHNHAERDGSVHGQRRAYDADGDIAEVADQPHEGHHEP